MSNIKKGKINTLDVVEPIVASEWHPTKNGELKPNQFLPQSNKKVWWLGKCGHEWEAVISSRTGTRKGGCPYCSNRKVLKGFNDLATTNPEILSEWDFEKNAISPYEIARGTNRKVWWKCSLGHSYESPVAGRTGERRRGCPYCANQKLLKGFNDLETRSPELAREWDVEKNDGVTPDMILAGGHKKVWWKCAKGHEWQSAIITRLSMNIGCPYCSGRYSIPEVNDLETTNPQLMLEWDIERNLPLTPKDVKAGSHTKVWWNCKDCGYSWQAFVSDRVRGNGCPSCSRTYRTSAPEQIVFFYVKKHFADAVNSYKPDWIGNSSEIDIFIPEKNIGIEYDGQRWHKNIDKDIAKNVLCNEHGITLLRIREEGCPKFPKEWPTIIAKNPGQNVDFMKEVVLKILVYLEVPNTETINIGTDLPEILSSYENNKQQKSLSFQYPEIAKDWNREKNGKLTPEMVTANSNRKLWWKCHNCGYEWQGTVNNRIKRGCPACANKVVWPGHNDLATLCPDYLEEWAYDLNVDISPKEITPGAEIKIWWRCSKCGYEWQTQPYRRKRGSNCPACAGKAVWPGHNDMETLFPEVAQEWNFEKNDGLLPSQVVAGSMKRVWWRCKVCGHEWQTGVDYRTHKKSGCPVCVRKKKK